MIHWHAWAGILFIRACLFGSTLETVSCQTAAHTGGSSSLCRQDPAHSPLYTVSSPSRHIHALTHTAHDGKKNTQTYAAAHTYATRPSVVEHMMDGPVRDHFTSERPPLPLPFFLLPHSQDTVFTFRRDIGSNVICLLGQLTYIDYLICHQKINTGVGASANHTSKSNSERNLSKKKINTVKKLVFVLPWLVCVCETHPGWSSNHRPASISALTSFHMDKMSTWVQCFQKAISQQSKHYFHLLWLPGQRKHQDVHSQTGSHTVLLKTLDLDRLYWQIVDSDGLMD